jgi:murein DD-endopeptidase MepM/ murein hydrolase activator NlpD
MYAHCNALLVKKGDTVKKGEAIAKIGRTGISTGVHLHFEYQINGVPQDPMRHISF